MKFHKISATHKHRSQGKTAEARLSALGMPSNTTGISFVVKLSNLPAASVSNNPAFYLGIQYLCVEGC